MSTAVPLLSLCAFMACYGRPYLLYYSVNRLSFYHIPHVFKSNQPPTNDYEGSFPGVKRLECEVNHPSLSSAVVKNGWRYSHSSPTCLHIEDKENVTFLGIALRDLKLSQ